jgi:hypothetical protein
VRVPPRQSVWNPWQNRFQMPILLYVSGGYGLMLWGGTTATVFLQVVASIRYGTFLPLTLVIPFATFVGTCVGSPFANVSSATREQLPSGIVHQLEVIG